ncbi:MAG: Phage tail protein [Firmicutes bacterium ADurb.Bin193]|nr:MAG: Phage tail protein [Firmicutes bacterium ADurb.Bin193]
MMGFKFDGIHCSNFGIVLRSKKRPVVPEPKIVKEDLPFRNGTYDFSASNPYGHIMYKDREISVECTVVTDGICSLRRISREIAAWLGGKEAPLVFDDESHVFYIGRVSNRIDFEQQISKLGSFTVVFTCHPFAYGSSVSGEIPSYGEGIFYGDHALYGGYNIFSANGDGVVPCVQNEPHLFKVYNFGWYVKPKIVISGSFENIRIGFSDLHLSYDGALSGGSFAFDCEKEMTIQNGMNITNACCGTFFELAPGENILSLEADSIDCDMFFVFRNLYL